MKPAPFAYLRPGSLDEVLAGLADGDAKVLAGGQSLVPVLAMRLGRPATLVDINSVPELSELSFLEAGTARAGTARADTPRAAASRAGAGTPRAGASRAGAGGVLRVGATVRQRVLERGAEVASVPLVARALPFVGHRELRSRGTVCGSLAHADPAAELPAVACCLGATLEIAGPRGIRRVPAEEFFAGAMTTSVAADEVLVAVELPVAGAGEGFGFAEIARRHGDFALAGVAVLVRRDGAHLRTARLTGFGISDRPVTRDVRPLLEDVGGDETALHAGVAELAAEMVDTGGDRHGSTGYRRRLFTVLGARELARAYGQAGERGRRL